MDHAKGQRTCLLCHLAVQLDELVVAAFDGNVRAQQPLFRPCKDFRCQNFPCYPCMTGCGPTVLYVHRDCYHYHQRFLSESTVRLRDILDLWPRVPDTFAASLKRNRVREKESYKHYLGKLVQLVSLDAGDECGKLLKSMTKLPNELLDYIAELSWPCALQQPAAIVAEAESVEEFLGRNKSINPVRFKYMGERVDVQHLTLFGYSYVIGLSIHQREERLHPSRRDGHLSIAIIRDEVGILDINFRGEFKISRRGCWYKLIRTDTTCMNLYVYIKDIVTDLRLAQNDAELPWDPYWDHQLVLPPRVPDWYIIEKSEYSPTFMRYIKVDDDIRGITVSCDVRGIISIYAHPHDRRMELYEETNASASADIVWLYFPLARSETITSGWIRELDNDLNVRHPALVLSTSSQRTCTFGSYVPPTSRNRYRFRSLGSELNHPVTGFCYNDMGMASATHFKLGMTYDIDTIHDSLLFKPSFEGMHVPPASTIPEWFVSAASLDGADRVCLCVDDEKLHMPTIGMLVIYADREESLGQWRYDRLMEDIELTEPIYVFSGEAAAGPFVRIVGNTEQKGEGWRKITTTNRIV